MNALKATLAAVGVAIAIVGVTAALPVQTRPQPAFAGAGASDKYDGDCTGHETEGRCADKCPAGSYLIGYKDDTSAAICKLEPTGCPYGDSVPLGPMCDKLAPAAQQPAETNNDPVTTAPPSNQCGGSK